MSHIGRDRTGVGGGGAFYSRNILGDEYAVNILGDK
jgi:hypothetical protein